MLRPGSLQRSHLLRQLFSRNHANVWSTEGPEKERLQRGQMDDCHMFHTRRTPQVHLQSRDVTITRVVGTDSLLDSRVIISSTVDACSNQVDSENKDPIIGRHLHHFPAEE